MSKWSDFGFPDIVFQGTGKIMFGLIRAARERYNATGYDFDSTYPGFLGDSWNYLGRVGSRLTCKNEAARFDSVLDGLFYFYVYPFGSVFKRASLDRCATDVLGESLVNPRSFSHTFLLPGWPRQWAYQRYRLLNILTLRIVQCQKGPADGVTFTPDCGLETEDVHGSFEFYDPVL